MVEVEVASNAAGRQQIRVRSESTAAWQWVCVVLSLTVGVWIRTLYLDALPFWVDEAESSINALTILQHGYPTDSYLGIPIYGTPLLTENRNGLVVDVRLTQATGTAERHAAADMLRNKPASRRVTVGADRGYDTRAFVAAMREISVTPHVAQNTTNRSSAIDARTTHHEGYAVSQRKRKRVEEVFGWMKTVALQRKTRFRGLERTGWMFTLAAPAYNLVRMRTLQVSTA